MKNVKLLAIVSFLLVVIFNLFILRADLATDGEQVLAIPDLRLHYSGSTIYREYFDRIDAAAVPQMVKALAWDYVYPLVYATFFFSVGLMLLSQGRYRRIYQVAVVAAPLFDYAENSLHIYLLNSLPARHIGLANIMGLFTSAKWLMILFIALSIVLALLKKLRSGLQ